MPSSSAPHQKDTPAPKVSNPSRPTVLDPLLQAEALRAKAELERLRRQTEEVAAASGETDLVRHLELLWLATSNIHPSLMSVFQSICAHAASDEEEEVVEGVVASTTTKDCAEHSAVDEDKIMLTIKSAKNQGGQKMRIGVNQPFSRLFTAYQEAGQAAGWLQPGTAVNFNFDGDRLKGTETPTSLDLEEGDVIDAVW